MSVDILLKRKAAAALKREAGWSDGRQRDMSVSVADEIRMHACWIPSRLYAACFKHRSARCWRWTNRSLGLQQSCLDFRVSQATSMAFVCRGPCDARFP